MHKMVYENPNTLSSICIDFQDQSLKMFSVYQTNMNVNTSKTKEFEFENAMQWIRFVFSESRES